MTKNSARKAFSDAQLFQVASLVQLANKVLATQDACHGVVKSGKNNPVIELSFQNHANLQIELRDHDYLAVVKSATDLPRASVEQAAYNTSRNKDGSLAGSYEANARRFSFESDDLQSLSHFVAAFAKAQRPEAPEPAAAVQRVANETTSSMTRSETLAYAERDYNILQQQKRVTSGALVHIPGTDAHMTPEALKAFKAELLDQGLVIRKPGSTKTPVAQMYLPEIVVGNKTITDNSTHYVEVVPMRVRRETRPDVAAVVVEPQIRAQPTPMAVEAPTKAPAQRSLQIA